MRLATSYEKRSMAEKVIEKLRTQEEYPRLIIVPIGVCCEVVNERTGKVMFDADDDETQVETNAKAA